MKCKITKTCFKNITSYRGNRNDEIVAAIINHSLWIENPCIISYNDLLYTIGYIQIDGFGLDKENKFIATAEFIKCFKSFRNVYTSEDNKLYLCGIPFDSLKMIHFIEPTDPEEYSLWYDSFSNELKVWRHTDTSEFADAFTFTSSNPNHPQIHYHYYLLPALLVQLWLLQTQRRKKI